VNVRQPARKLKYLHQHLTENAPFLLSKDIPLTKYRGLQHDRTLTAGPTLNNALLLGGNPAKSPSTGSSNR
jgi:hypothetical protein